MVERFTILLILLLCGMGLQAQPSGKLEYVESGVTMRMNAPIMKDGSRKFYLDFRTNDVYECSNFALENEVRLEGNKLAVKVRGVRRHEPCSPKMGPATARIDLSSLDMGKYKFRVSINRQIFKAELQITENFYDLQINDEDPSLFRIYNGRLNLIPENTIWGICEYSDPERKKVAEKFMSALSAAGASKTELIAGNYGEFYLHYDGNTDEKMVTDDKFEYPFVFSYEGDEAVLAEVINSFREKLRITLKNTKGEVSYNF